MKRFDFRGFVSTLLTVDFFVLLVTGIGLFVAPSGRIANEIGFKFLGMDKDALESIHTIFGYLMVVLIPFHLYYNWRIFLNYFWKLVKGVRKLRLRESLVALSITIFLFLSGLYGFPPASTVSDLGEKISVAIERNYRAEHEGVEEEYARVGVRGYMTLDEAARNLGVDLDVAIERLKNAGIDASPTDKVKDLMNEYGLSAHDIESIISGE